MEEILEKLGHPGRYHIFIAILFAITWWSVCLGNVSVTFTGITPEHTCNIALSLQMNNGTISNVPTCFDTSMCNITVSEDQCSYTIHTSGEPVDQDCRSWIFEDDGGSLNTLTSEWSLVCKDDYKLALSNTIFFCGVFLGALIFGFISDHLGRKKTLAICLYTQMPISLAIAFMPNYISYTVMRFILGIWLQGISSIAFLHCIEFFRQKHRGVVMVGFGISWAFGQFLTAFLAYFLPNWRHVQMVASGVALVTIPYYWWLPESPRWLLVKARYEEISSGFITRAARVNGLNVAETVTWCSQQLQQIGQQQALTAETERPQSFLNVLKTPVLLMRLLAMCFMWCVASMTYYVFILNSSNLAGNRYLNFAIGAALEILVNLVMIFVLARFSRKRPLLLCFFLIGVFCIICGTIPKTSGGVDISLVVTAFALIGKMLTAAFLCLIFVYAAELFPTFARGSCLALCGCSMRIGGIVAPQVTYLRSIVFEEFPYIVIAALIFACGVITLCLPDTYQKSMPNTIEEAVDMLPEPMNDKSKDDSTLHPCLGTQSSESDTSSNSTEQEKFILTQRSQPC